MAMMMKVRMGLAVAALAGAMGMGAFALQPAKKEEPKKEMNKEGEHHAAAQAKSAAMEALRTLAGTWEVTRGPEDMPKGTTVYKVTSGGSVVLETMFPGTDHEMTNTFHMDGKDLVFTHYCAIGNQPRLRCEDAQNAKVLVFKFKDGQNLDPRKDGYMGALTLTIVDSDHIRQEWTYFEEGKPQPAEHPAFEYARKK